MLEIVYSTRIGGMSLMDSWMRPEIGELEAFYGSRAGQFARRLVGHQLRQLWANVEGLTVAGVGYAVPFLTGLESASHLVGLMPAAQGITPWPCESASRVALVQEDELPLADRSVDRLLLAHALECTGDPKRLMREVWRVLADNGRAVFVVPNRRGLWCLSERTPFGCGQPFSVAQLHRMLRRHLFEPRGERAALYLPPTHSRLLLRLSIPVERLGLGLARPFGGVVLVEAQKCVYVGTPSPATSRVKARRYVAAPANLVGAPARAPVSLAA